MALFLDRHDAPGATATDIAAAHVLDLGAQESYGVRYVTYWFDESNGIVCCLAEGPDRESLEAVHRDAHGLVADNIIEVGEGPINAFLGALPQHNRRESRTSILRSGPFSSPISATPPDRPRSSGTRPSWTSSTTTTRSSVPPWAIEVGAR